MWNSAYRYRLVLRGDEEYSVGFFRGVELNGYVTPNNKEYLKEGSPISVGELKLHGGNLSDWASVEESWYRYWYSFGFYCCERKTWCEMIFPVFEMRCLPNENAVVLQGEYVRDLSVEFFEVLEERQVKDSVDYGEWKKLTLTQKKAWVEVACAFFEQKIDRSNLKIEIDGRFILDEPSFYCALGEAVNGPGGYFGQCLDSLHDCLCGEFGVSMPMNLVWRDYEVSQKAYYEAGLKERMNKLHRLFNDMNVQVEFD